ncbi:hypothetical protein [Tenacibaculum maritimum]|uniref:hypothetical protein n=1 Tax=Tenacibaculum maritimum TaxID=107401 RepID=UPI001A95EEC9|nr:hypothetical protein [Tenacibaculum maritimum]
MKIHIYIFIFLLGVVTASCEKELVDFTQVTNPNLSEASVIGQPNSAESWLVGIRRQMAIVSNEAVVMSEIASDNYVNTQTFYNQLLDGVTIDTQDTDIRDLQFAIARLREMTVFGIQKVAPADINVTDVTIAEFNFYKGISYLLAGEYFSFLPAEEKGVPQSSQENYNLAIESFKEAERLNNSSAYQLALARAYYNLSNKTEAVLAANNSLGLDPNLLVGVEFDQAEGPSSTIESALFERGSFDDLQPLPSLDFLDPKYSFLSNERDQSTALLKSEEAYFIIAEAELSEGKLEEAKLTMKKLITLINSREKRTIDDTVEGRDQDNPGSRPNKAATKVKYVGDVTFKTGLVVDRNNAVTVAIVSGTSITNTVVEAANTIDTALEILYLMRQEVFIAEGRRIVDLGVKYVMHENEQLLNPNIDASHPGLTPIIPSFISAIKSELDAFSYKPDVNEVEIKHNLNKILVLNKTSDLVIPFF